VDTCCSVKVLRFLQVSQVAVSCGPIVVAGTNCVCRTTVTWALFLHIYTIYIHI